jgi:hypothetical protein
VNVVPGARSASFSVETSTVLASATSTITAAYGGSTTTAVLTVTPPAVSASFVVRSPIMGVGACQLEDSEQELDCILDGSASTGFLDAWIWTYTAGTSQLTQTSREALTHPQIGTKCAFLNTATGGDGPNGDRYLRMEISLQVQDKAGNRSTTVRQPIRLYPNRRCGFSY